VPHVCCQIDDRLAVYIALSERQGFQQVSFVNSVSTTGGGLHVNGILASLWKKLAAVIQNQNRGPDVATLEQMARHVCLFVNCRILGPTFDSPTKEKLVGHRNVVGKALWELPDDFVQRGRTPSHSGSRPPQLGVPC
jgi:DNA topoisomerase-2